MQQSSCHCLTTRAGEIPEMRLCSVRCSFHWMVLQATMHLAQGYLLPTTISIAQDAELHLFLLVLLLPNSDLRIYHCTNV